MKNLNVMGLDSKELLEINGGHEGNSFTIGKIVGIFAKSLYIMYKEHTKEKD